MAAGGVALPTKPASKITPDYVVEKMLTNDWLIYYYEEYELISISDLKKKYK